MQLDTLINYVLQKEEAILLIIDIQDRLLPVMAQRETVLENAIRLVKFSRIMGIPIIVTEQHNLGPTTPQLRAELGDIQAICKWEFDCLSVPAFVEQVRQLKRNTLIIAGIEAHVCVAQTALHARPYYNVHVVSDAISSRSLHNWEIAIGRMRQQGITITSTEMVIFELLKRAGTDEFREALKLIK